MFRKLHSMFSEPIPKHSEDSKANHLYSLALQWNHPPAAQQGARSSDLPKVLRPPPILRQENSSRNFGTWNPRTSWGPKYWQRNRSRSLGGDSDVYLDQLENMAVGPLHNSQPSSPLLCNLSQSVTPIAALKPHSENRLLPDLWDSCLSLLCLSTSLFVTLRLFSECAGQGEKQICLQ